MLVLDFLWFFSVCLREAFSGDFFLWLQRVRSMRGGCKKFLAIVSKSFDLSVVGTREDILKISENGRGRRFSILLPEEVVLWLLRAWARFQKFETANWCNQMRLGSRIFMLESMNNRVGKYLQLSVIIDGERSFVIFPIGWNEWGGPKCLASLLK